MKSVYFSLLIALCLSNLGYGQSITCEKEQKLAGTIKREGSGGVFVKHCSIIEVPQDSYVRLDVKELVFNGIDCSGVNIEISVAGTGEVFKFCAREEENRKPIIALNDVTIKSSLKGSLYTGSYYKASTFTIVYRTESLLCGQKSYFRCSDHLCIHQHQVCDGVKDCEDGVDELGCAVTSIKGVNASREIAIAWLKSQRSDSFGWEGNTHRAMTALYLSGDAYFDGSNLQEELIVKELELQTSVALLRNSTDPLSVSDLSMFVNALLAACHDPGKFYGLDLIQILGDRAASSNSPGAYLTLCNANWTLSATNVQNLLKLLNDNSEYPFIIDAQAMAVMALTCVKSKTKIFGIVENSTKIYNEMIQKFIRRQHPDGSFGNVHTTAIVTQALISSGQKSNKMWNVSSTMNFLMEHQNASDDFLITYLTLPILNDKSLVDLAAVNCSKKRDKDGDITDVTDNLNGKIEVKYSLYIGDRKNVVHTIYLRVGVNSTAYDVMRVAQVADPKYKFLHRIDAGQLYVYEIAGIANDPEALKIWLLYTKDSESEAEEIRRTQSPDKLILKDGEHLIMWFKTVHI